MTQVSFPAKLRRLTMITLGALMLSTAVVPVRAQSAPQPDQAAMQRADKKQTVLNETDAYRMSPQVVKIGSMFGMGPETSANVFTIFNLVILVGAIGYGLGKTLPKAFRKRSSTIQKQLVDARTATEEATSRLNSVEERLAKLDGQIAAMQKQSEADIAREEQRIRASVEDEKLKIIAAAEAEIQSATTLARRDIQRYAADLAIEQAARKLVVTPETDRMLVESFAHRLGEGSNN